MNVLKHIWFGVALMTGVALLFVSLLWILALGVAVMYSHGVLAGTAWLVVATGTVLGIISGVTDRGQ